MLPAIPSAGNSLAGGGRESNLGVTARNAHRLAASGQEWSFQSETVNQPVIMKTATTFEVADTTASGDAQEIIFIAEGQGTWSVVDGRGNPVGAGSATYFPNSNLNALSQAMGCRKASTIKRIGRRSAGHSHGSAGSANIGDIDPARL